MSTVPESAIKEYDVVRVRSLDGMRHDCAGLGTRAPMIGDLGTIVSILDGDDRHETFLVECVQPDASTAWIAAFPGHALEPATHAETAP